MSNEVFTLNDLKNNDNITATPTEVGINKTETPEPNTLVNNGIREVSINEIAPASKKADPGQEYVQSLFNDLDRAIEREKVRITDLQQDLFEKETLKEIDNDIEDTADAVANIPTTTSTTEMEAQTKNEEEAKDFNLALDVDEEDFFKDIDDEEDSNEDNDVLDEDDEKDVEEIKKSIKDKIIPIVHSIDLSKFTINSKPISINKLLSHKAPNYNTADWVLYSSKRSITVSELSGPEIEKLDPRNTSGNRLNTYKGIYEIIYKHLVDANKPEFETWLKSMNFFDINHLYFAIYRACFSGTNSIPYSCPECGKMFMEDIDINKLVKYKNDDVKKEVEKILAGDTTTTDSVFNVELKQISDDYVVALRDPSVYNVIFETASLDQEFTDKYKDLLGIISYIDAFYKIDRENNSLAPVSTSPDPDNMVKTTKRKIKIYYEILSTLTSDQYYALTSYVKNINDRSEEVTYVLPEVTCPKCKHKIAEAAQTADAILFTRHRLGAIASI